MHVYFAIDHFRDGRLVRSGNLKIESKMKLHVITNDKGEVK